VLPPWFVAETEGFPSDWDGNQVHGRFGASIYRLFRPGVELKRQISALPPA
jgi:hypothetical protein